MRSLSLDDGLTGSYFSYFLYCWCMRVLWLRVTVLNVIWHGLQATYVPSRYVIEGYLIKLITELKAGSVELSLPNGIQIRFKLLS